MLRARAFTLIELLIVVAIIAILAAIAVPNFLEAQTRSKISRVKADMRSVSTAIESYAVDYNLYPPEQDRDQILVTLSDGDTRCGSGAIGTASWRPCEFANRGLKRLTTPIAYITSTESMRDPFLTATSTYAGYPLKKVPFPFQFYVDFRTRAMWPQVTLPPGTSRTQRAWGLQSLGPDSQDNGITNAYFTLIVASGQVGAFINTVYDPTNGTVSSGDLTRFGGEIPAQMQSALSSVR